MKVYITGTRRGLGKALANKLLTVDTIEDCDIFINCKHDGFTQVDLLYKAAKLNKRIINIGSNSTASIYYNPQPNRYAIEKAALEKANEQLYYQGVNTTVLNFGYFDTERVAHVNKPKMDLDYVVGVVMWVIDTPYRIKDITTTV